MNSPELVFLGWHAPAIELVAQKMLAGLDNPQTAAEYRRATVVVPTAESGRRLREYVAELAGKPVLLPRIVLAGHLIPGEYAHAATELDTLAAWLQVLGAEGTDPVAQYAPLIPRRPETHRERWAVGVALKLMALRTRLAQEEVTPEMVGMQLSKREVAYQTELDHMAPDFLAARKARQAGKQVVGSEQVRWRRLQSLFEKVDAMLLPQKNIEQAQAEFVLRPEWPKQSRLLIMACVPEFSPQIKTLLRHLHGKDGGRVQIWIHAPETESSQFDDFGLPLEDAWVTREIQIPQAFVYADEKHEVLDQYASTIHVVDDAQAMAEEAVRLAGGHDSRDVVLAVGDAEFSPAILHAFSATTPAWLLNLPEGRSAQTLELGKLPRQLAEACEARLRLPLWDAESGKIRNNNVHGLETFVALLTNRALQHALADNVSELMGLQEHVEKIRMQLLPGSEEALLKMLEAIPEVDAGYKSIGWLKRQQQAAFHDYAVKVNRLITGLCGGQIQAFLHRLADRIENSHADGVCKQLAVGIAQQMRECAGVCMKLPSNLCTLELLRRLVEDKVNGPAFAERENTVGNLLGWRELAYAHGRQVILGAMHDGCIPEPVQEDDFLPESLCNELGLRHERFRTARDSYLLTALIESRRAAGRVDFIIARQKADGSVLAPSSLLMRCGKEQPKRARVLFAESKTPQLLPKPASCPLRRATGNSEPILPGELEHISQIAPDMKNPFTNAERKLQKKFSPSLLSSFLQCPLTFWVKNLFKIDMGDTYKEHKGELESNEYGTIMHAVLAKLVERFPSQAALLAECPSAAHDAHAAETHMLTIARHIAANEWMVVYNNASPRESQSLAMEVQLQALERTLAGFVRQHCNDLSDGWYNVAREYTMEPTMRICEVDVARFSMNADRIDRHADGRWRIIDYKTSGSEKKPHKVHFDVLDEDSPYCRFMNVQGYQFGMVYFGEKLYRWNDVQLPLYAYGLRHASETDKKNWQIKPGEDMSTVVPDLLYYNLQCKAEKFERFPLVENGKVEKICDKTIEVPSFEEMFDSAMQTVESAIGMIRAGKCLFSAEALEFTTKPYSSISRPGSNMPRFGMLSLRRDPRSLFNLPDLKK